MLLRPICGDNQALSELFLSLFQHNTHDISNGMRSQSLQLLISAAHSTQHGTS